jgi:hypothetical protein
MLRALILLTLVLPMTANADEIAVQKTGKGAFTLSVESGAISGPDGKAVGRIDTKTGFVYFGEKMVGQISKAGLISEAGNPRGRLDKTGVIKKGNQPVGHIDDQDGIFHGNDKWGTARGCGANFERKRLVAGFLAFYSTDFISAPVKSADPPPDPNAITISRGGARWAYVGGDGTITLESGGQAGAIDSSGQITNSSGVHIGSIDGHGQVDNASSVHLGAVHADGSLSGFHGHIGRDGKIVGPSGADWGFYEGGGSDKVRRVAAALLFFAPSEFR